MSLHEYPFFEQVGLMSVGHARLSLSHFQVNLCLNPNSIRKSYPHLVFCIVALKVKFEGPFPLSFESLTSKWTHQLEAGKNLTSRKRSRGFI